MDVEMLIAAVRKHEILYNTSLEGSRNATLKNKAWIEVGYQLRQSPSICKKRWKSLRDTYRRCQRMSRSRSLKGEAEPKKKWQYTEHLRFMDILDTSNAIQGSVDPDVLAGIQWKVVDFPECGVMGNMVQGHATVQYSTPVGTVGRTQRVIEKFPEFVENVTKGVAENARGSEKNCTVMLFEALARKILDAGLSPTAVNELEAKVISVVYNEINKTHH